MINICKRDFGKNKGLGCYLYGHLEGYCEYFLEFSEWRFGLTVYISSLFISKGELSKEVLTQFFEYLRRYQDLTVSTLRIILKGCNDELSSIAPKIHKLNYDVLEIKLDPKMAKLWIIRPNIKVGSASQYSSCFKTKYINSLIKSIQNHLYYK